MNFSRVFRMTAAVLLVGSLAACGGRGGNFLAGLGGSSVTETEVLEADTVPRGDPTVRTGTSIFSLIKQRDDGTKVGVNRYLWNASLDVLDFLPVQSVDPYTGVIVTGYGTPPGGGRSYRATIYVRDPALEARSLNVSLLGRNGRPVSASTQRAVEDAILTRARQMRVADGRF